MPFSLIATRKVPNSNSKLWTLKISVFKREWITNNSWGPREPGAGVGGVLAPLLLGRFRDFVSSSCLSAFPLWYRLHPHARCSRFLAVVSCHLRFSTWCSALSQAGISAALSSQQLQDLESGLFWGWHQLAKPFQNAPEMYISILKKKKKKTTLRAHCHEVGKTWDKWEHLSGCQRVTSPCALILSVTFLGVRAQQRRRQRRLPLYLDSSQCPVPGTCPHLYPKLKFNSVSYGMDWVPPSSYTEAETPGPVAVLVDTILKEIMTFKRDH